MQRVTIRLPKRDLDELRRIAKQSGRSVSQVVRDAVRVTLPRRTPDTWVGLWDGKLRRSSTEHD